MAESEPRERAAGSEAHLPVSVFAAERPGPLSPFGEDVEFPLPPTEVTYVHPSAEDRPKLAHDPYSWD
jgi:succinate dehydrogenase / fumarate reductase iron-sulfur subunit